MTPLSGLWSWPDFSTRRPADHRKTFGYHRAEILVALANGAALVAIAGFIFYEAVLRFFHPQEIKTGILLAVAAIGSFVAGTISLIGCVG